MASSTVPSFLRSARTDRARALEVVLGEEAVAHEHVPEVFAFHVARGVEDLALEEAEAAPLLGPREMQVARTAPHEDVADELEERAGVDDGATVLDDRGDGRRQHGRRGRRRFLFRAHGHRRCGRGRGRGEDGGGGRAQAQPRRERPQRVRELGRVLVAGGRVLGQGLAQDGDEGPVLRRVGEVECGILVGDLVEDRHDPVRVERARAAHQLVEHRARGEEVAAAVHHLAAHLLRRHVFGGAHHHPRPRDVAHREAGDAEVHDLDAAFPGEEHVGGLDVAVDDPDLVRVGQALQHGDHDADLALEAEGRGGPHHVEEVVPAEELHRDVGRPVGVVAEIEDGHHVGVHHARDRARLALEAVLLLGVARDLGQHHLEGDVALQERVAGVVHDAHGSRAQAAQDLVLADTRREVRGDGLRLRLRRDFLGIRAQASEFNGGPLALEARAPGVSRMARTPGAPCGRPARHALLLLHFLVGLAVIDGAAGATDEPADEGAFLAPHQRADAAPPAADPPMIIALCFLDRVCT
jgi:hypothetical protein